MHIPVILKSKTVLAVVVAAAVILAVLYSVPAWEFDATAPTADIHVTLEKAGTDTVYAGDIEIEPENMLNSMMSVHTMTTYTADVPPLEPLDAYIIKFVVAVTTTGSSTSETYNTVVSITGGNNNLQKIGGTMQSYNYTTISGVAEISGSYMGATSGQEVSITPSSGYPYCQAKGVTTGYLTTILGSYVDGSSFNIQIVSTGTGGSYGMTTATLNIVVGAGGTLSVEIGGITTTVQEL